MQYNGLSVYALNGQFDSTLSEREVLYFIFNKGHFYQTQKVYIKVIQSQEPHQPLHGEGAHSGKKHRDGKKFHRLFLEYMKL